MVNELQESAEFHIDDNKWVRVSSSEAAAKCKSTVSCYMQLFRCPKCKQYLSFVNSENHLTIPYFRHPPGSADCPLKLDNENTGQVYIPYTYTRVKKSFEFPISICDTNKRKLSIKIHFKDFDTNLKIEEPFPKSLFLVENPGYPNFHYYLRFEGGHKFLKFSLPNKIKLGDLAPKHIDVIRKNGALFTAGGTKVKYGRSPVIGETYLFLVPSSFAGKTSNDNFSLPKEKLLSKGVGWSLYKIKLTGTGLQANFIYDMGYNYPSIFKDLEPIWPPAVSDFNSNKIRYTFFQKNEAFIAELNEDPQPFIKLDCNTKYDPPEGFSIHTNHLLFQKGITRYLSDNNVLAQKSNTSSNEIKVAFTPLYDGVIKAYEITKDGNFKLTFENKFLGEKKQEIILQKIETSFVLKIFYSLDCVYCQSFLNAGNKLKKLPVSEIVAYIAKEVKEEINTDLQPETVNTDDVAIEKEEENTEKKDGLDEIIKESSDKSSLSINVPFSKQLDKEHLSFKSGTVFLCHVVNCQNKNYFLPIAYMEGDLLNPISSNIKTTNFNAIYPYMIEIKGEDNFKNFEKCIISCDSNETFSYPFTESIRDKIKIMRRPLWLSGLMKGYPFSNIKDCENDFNKLDSDTQLEMCKDGVIYHASIKKRDSTAAVVFKKDLKGAYSIQSHTIDTKKIVVIRINGIHYRFYPTQRYSVSIKGIHKPKTVQQDKTTTLKLVHQKPSI